MSVELAERRMKEALVAELFFAMAELPVAEKEQTPARRTPREEAHVTRDPVTRPSGMRTARAAGR